MYDLDPIHPFASDGFQQIVTAMKFKDPSFYFTQIYPCGSDIVKKYLTLHHVNQHRALFLTENEPLLNQWESKALQALNKEELQYLKNRLHDEPSQQQIGLRLKELQK